MNIGDKAFFVGQGNQQPVGVIVQAIGVDDKLFCKPLDNHLVSAYWLTKSELFTDINQVRDVCVSAYKMRLKSNLTRLANA